MSLLEPAIALLALTAMEIVLGIDNIVFISVATSRLPPRQQAVARQWGLGLAMGTRILLLLFISWILGLTAPLIELQRFGVAAEWLAEHPEVNLISWRDLILFVGGLFLIQSSVREIHHKVEGQGEHGQAAAPPSFWSVVIQIGLLDIIFSLDSVITAVGMAKHVEVMIAAVVLAVIVMMVFAGTVSAFVERHPTVKILALSFLLLIGVMLVAEAVGTHINKGYIYFAMAFSLLVEFLNLRMRTKSAAAQADHLH